MRFDQWTRSVDEWCGGTSPSTDVSWADDPGELRALADIVRQMPVHSVDGVPPATALSALVSAETALRRAADRIDQFDAAIAQRDEARHVVSETLWMAGRYANGRQTYAVKMYNDARKIAQAGGYASKAEPAVDGGNMETTDAA